jgi:hypothetical protein
MYTLSINSKVSPARKPIEDGEYQVTVKALVTPETTNPYISFATADNRELRFYINSDVSLEIITSNINRQLDIDVADDVDIFSWFEDIKGSEVTLWVLTTQGTDKDGNAVSYQNVTPYKPSMFDAIMSDLI